MNRTTKAEREGRREKVKLLLSLRFPISQIALQLKVSRRTIMYDVKYIRREWGVQLKTVDIDQLIAEVIFDLNNRRRELYAVAQKPDSQRNKMRAIIALGKENDRVIALLQSIGKVDKIPDEWKGTVKFEFGDNGISNNNSDDGQDGGEKTIEEK